MPGAGCPRARPGCCCPGTARVLPGVRLPGVRLPGYGCRGYGCSGTAAGMPPCRVPARAHQWRAPGIPLVLGLEVSVEPGDDVVEHGVLLGLVEDLVVQPLIDLVREVE